VEARAAFQNCKKSVSFCRYLELMSRKRTRVASTASANWRDDSGMARRRVRAYPLLLGCCRVMASQEKRNAPTSPEEDEWGFYDPEEAGLPAVLGRLDAKSSESAASYAARIARTLRRPDKPVRSLQPTKTTFK